MERVELAITGMTCEHCARTIKTHLGKEPGVKHVEVAWNTGCGEVEFDPAVTNVASILKNPVFAGHYSARIAPGADGD